MMLDRTTSAYSSCNDLTYSDESDDDFELGIGSSDQVSPETQALLDQIQNSILFPAQEPNREQSHLVHPLARGESLHSELDEQSYLAYSLSTGGGGEDEKALSVSYGSTNSDSAQFDLKPKNSSAVIFRPPSVVFDPPIRPSSPLPDISEHKEASESESSGGQEFRSVPQDGTTACGQQPHSVKPGLGYPYTPQPDLASESPVTSATVDSPPDSSNGPNRQTIDEKERKRLRRHKRLIRIRKAAEARENAVREVRGVDQAPTSCNDAVFAFMFLCQFLLVSMSALAFLPSALQSPHDSDVSNDVGDFNPFEGLQVDDIIIMDEAREVNMPQDRMVSHIDYLNVIQLACIASGYAVLCSLLTLGFMVMLSKNLLHVALVFTMLASVSWTVIGLSLKSHWVISMMGLAFMVWSCVYTLVSWDRIPFAATNLSVALMGMRSTLDILLLGMCIVTSMFLYTVMWLCAAIGTYDYISDEEGVSNDWLGVIVVLFGFSYVWTFQVIKALSQATVAGIIGRWWELSEDEIHPLCSNALSSSLLKIGANSFGSICLGGLIVMPCMTIVRLYALCQQVQFKLEQLTQRPIPISRSISENTTRSDVSLMAIFPQDCCTGRIKVPSPSVRAHVNQWSFTYIGLYAYTFFESGSKASELFEARGWTDAVSDDLVSTVVTMSSIIIGGGTACLGSIVEEADGLSLTTLNKPITTAFLICLFCGFTISSAFLSIVEGAINAILVCYASRPVQFHVNHFQLSERMKFAWRDLWVMSKPKK
mmetsp:Transcript_6503/g.14722  ORF Transcript_6503/g.14722 Transcript_6503/m.14722 type:complete len:765 (-) Transcript_6503:182-2476(-)